MLLTLFSMFMIEGCDVHEFPELPTKTSFILHLDFETEIPLYKEIERVRSRAGIAEYDVRHIVSIHQLDENGDYNRRADSLVVFTCDDVVNLNCSRELILKEGKYKLFVWTDYVNEGSDSDLFYVTSQFEEIILSDKENHIGNSDYRDAFKGSQDITVTIKESELMPVDNEATIVMKRPLAKFKFISTDYEIFIENAQEALATKKGRQTDEDDSGSRTINPEDYTVVFRYPAYMSCSYNMFTDKPADGWTNISFDSKLIFQENGEVELGFDYVFVNGSESSISVQVEVYDKEGELIGASFPIDVPLVRSRLTIVKGQFLTSKSAGGAGINPTFDGEYNIIIE